jgi:hypothetical protein
MPLKCEAECNVDAGIRRVAQIIHAVNLDHKNILRVEPVAGPRVNESEPIATVLEAVIPAVIGLADTKPVFPSKTSLETVVGNAVTTVTMARCACCSCLASYQQGIKKPAILVASHRAAEAE